MSFEAGPVFALLVLGVLYSRAVWALGRRGYRVPTGQRAFWWIGFGLLALAFLGPLDVWAEDYVSSHMAQHMLMADVAAPLMLMGIRNPVLQFFLPRAVLEPLARRRGLRSQFRRLRNPMYAVPFYVVVLFLWHAAPLFEAALRDPVVHALQHESFVVFSALVWLPIIEPERRRMPGKLWKIPYFFGARLPTMLLGMGFVFSTALFYDGFYGSGDRPNGMSALSDQQLGGGIMMGTDVVLLMVVLAVVFWRSARDDDAQAPDGEADAQRHLGGVQQEAGAEGRVQVAEVR